MMPDLKKPERADMGSIMAEPQRFPGGLPPESDPIECQESIEIPHVAIPAVVFDELVAALTDAVSALQDEIFTDGDEATQASCRIEGRLLALVNILRPLARR